MRRIWTLHRYFYRKWRETPPVPELSLWFLVDVLIDRAWWGLWVSSVLDGIFFAEVLKFF
jgi:hypothetical protein